VYTEPPSQPLLTPCVRSIVINNFEKLAKNPERSICVCYIYIRYSDNAGLTVRHCLEVLVKQTIEKHPSCLALAEKTYANHLRLKTRPSEDELLDLMQAFTTLVEITFYFIDALDEAPVYIQYDLVSKLSSLNIKLFITSRPMKSLEARFPDACSFCIAANDRDLELHINREIERSCDLCGILEGAGPTLRAELVSSVKQNCGGM
jgi:hypothetical protein